VVSAATVGSREEAEDGRGPYDFVAPPTRFQEASLRIQPPGESSPDGRRTYLATEYRPPSADGHRFDLVLSATPGEPVVVRAEELRGIGDRRVALIDGSGEQHDLRSGAARIVPEQKQTSLKLVVGTASLVEETAGEVLPDRLRLRGNYPNPFNEQTTITYDLPETKTVEVAVYDMLGRRVKTLVDQKQEPGTHRVRWQAQSDDARAVSSGVYFVRLETGSTQLVEKLVVVR
jgi:methionine-rich copper-binding protein CopC